MKKIFQIFLFALLTVGLASCAKDAFTPEETHEYPAPQGRTLTFGFDNPETRAVDTWNMEKLIFSVAIFIDTDAGFYKFFSTEPDGSPMGFHEVLNKRESSNPDHIQTYTAGVSVDLPYDITDIINIAVVGNYDYPDDNYTDRLKAVDSWEKLKVFQAPAALRGITMNTFTNQGLLSTKVFTTDEIADLVQSNSTQVELRRLAARIRPDFNLLVEVEGETSFPVEWTGVRDNGLFKITTLIVCNPKSATYLFPDLVYKDDRTAIAQYERFDPNETFNGSSRYLYFYEMTGDEPEPLVMYLIFEYRASKTIPWEDAEEGLASITLGNPAYGGECVLEHHHAYEVVFDMMVSIPAATVSDWDKDHWLVGRPKG